MEIVKTNRLCFAYIKKPLLLYNVNLNLNGGVLWLFAAEGSGKTTLLELLCGMQGNFMGEILICGKSPKDSTDNISYLPEKVIALNNKSVQKNLEFAATVIKKSFDKIDYQDPFINQFKDTKVKKLSPYNKAVFALIRAEIKSAKLLLIDINLDGFTDTEVISYAQILEKTFKNAKNRQIIAACSAKDYIKLQIDIPEARYAYLFGELSEYDSLQNYANNLKYCEMAEYVYNFKTQATINSTINGYVLNLLGKTLKIEEGVIEPIKSYFEVSDSADVVVFSDTDFASISQNELQSYINNKRFLVFDSLSRERLI